MKNLLTLLIPTFLLIILLGGCGNGEIYKAEIAGIDSLLTQMDSAEIKFNGIDSAAARKALQTVNADLGKLTSLYTDTMKKEEAMLLSTYRSVKKPLKEYLLKLPIMSKELEVTRKQLNDLRHDLEKELLKKEDAKMHYKKETELARLLINSLEVSAQSVGIFLDRFNGLNPRIDSLVQVKETEFQTKKIK